MRNKKRFQNLATMAAKAKYKRDLKKAEADIELAHQGRILSDRINGYMQRVDNLNDEELQAFYEDYVAYEALCKKMDIEIMPSEKVFGTQRA